MNPRIKNWFKVTIRAFDLVGMWVRQRTWSELTAYTGALLGALIPIIRELLNPERSWFLIIALFIAFIAAVATVASSAQSNRETKKAEVEYRKGFRESIGTRRVTVRLEAGAYARLHRQLQSLMASIYQRISEGNVKGWVVKEERGEETISSFMDTVRDIVATAFNKSASEIVVNLVLKNRDGNLQTVYFSPEVEGRSPGRTFIVNRNRPDNGVVCAWVTKERQYISDATKEAHIPENRPYKAIMSWPILCGDNITIVGVLNIDSHEIGGFDDEENRETAYAFSAAILKGIAIALIDPRCFSSLR